MKKIKIYNIELKNIELFYKKENFMFKKILFFFIFLFLIVSFSYGANDYGDVKDNNNGNKGDILINAGETHGGKKNDVGTWVNVKDVPELKGEKGDRGEQGIQGKQGIRGKTGAKGEKGEVGLQGKGLKDRREFQYEEVIISEKRFEVSVYAIYDFNNQISTTGAKVKHYFGQSWTERQLEKVNVRLNKLEEEKGQVVPTKTGFKIEK